MPPLPNVTLTPSQVYTLIDLHDAILRVKNEHRVATFEDIARVKKYAEEFLAYPIVQCLSTEGL